MHLWVPGRELVKKKKNNAAAILLIMPCSHLWLKPRMCNHCPCIVTNILENIAVTPFLTGRCLLSQWDAPSRGQSNCFKMCITHHCTVWLITQVPKPNNSMLYVQQARPHMLFFPFSFSELLLQSDFTIFYHLKAALVAMKQSLKPSLGGRQANLQTPPPLTSYFGASFHESSWKEKDSPRKLRWNNCSAAL